ncbi:MAG: DUF6471 domain-containing protein, partial [Rhizomicrobium sp.]
DVASTLGKHGVKGETRHSVTSKLARGTFPATFFLGALAAMKLEALRLEDI